MSNNNFQDDDIDQDDDDDDHGELVIEDRRTAPQNMGELQTWRRRNCGHRFLFNTVVAVVG